MRTAPPPPTRGQVEEKFLALLDGRESRDSVDRWAGQWVAADDGVDDPAVWWGLYTLHGIDARHGHNQPFLFTEEQIGEWLEEFRHRCSAM